MVREIAMRKIVFVTFWIIFQGVNLEGNQLNSANKVSQENLQGFTEDSGNAETSTSTGTISEQHTTSNDEERILHDSKQTLQNKEHVMNIEINDYQYDYVDDTKSTVRGCEIDVDVPGNVGVEISNGETVLKPEDNAKLSEDNLKDYNDESSSKVKKKMLHDSKSPAFSLEDILDRFTNPNFYNDEVSKSDMQNISVSEDISQNTTETNYSAGNKTDKVKFRCVGRNITENSTVEVKLANSTELIDMLSFKHVNSTCVVVMFYAPWCMFCARTAPHYNALARAFPQLDVLAVDAVHFNSLNARFGTVSVPNILLFHNSRAVMRFNQTERNFNTLVEFIEKVTGLESNKTVNVTDDDYIGPLPSIPSDDPEIWLFVCWIFILLFGGWLFGNSESGQSLWKSVTSFGHEHVHID